MWSVQFYSDIYVREVRSIGGIVAYTYCTDMAENLNEFAGALSNRSIDENL